MVPRSSFPPIKYVSEIMNFKKKVYFGLNLFIKHVVARFDFVSWIFRLSCAAFLSCALDLAGTAALSFIFGFG